MLKKITFLFLFILPVIALAQQKPSASFTVNANAGLTTDTFRFTNLTTNNPTSYSWSFSPSGVFFINNTNATSANPIVILPGNVQYTVRLIASNNFGSDTSTKNNFIQIYSYTTPQSLQNASTSEGNISITRVMLPPGIDTTTHPNTPAYINVQGNQRALLYRGKKNGITIFRQANTTAAECRAWIDFNRNGAFETSELILNKSNINQLSISDSFFIPPNQPVGYTFMRVLMALNSPTLNATIAGMGVYRDYRINIGLDTIKPAILLNSSNVLYGQINKSFFDPMATATDNREGDISHRVERTGNVDTNNIGSYTLKYFVKDLYNNCSDTLTRQVLITLNQTAPTLNLLGDSVLTLEVNTKYTEPGYNAFDNANNNLNAFVTQSGNLDTANIGLYTLIYSVTDAFNRTTVTRRYVRVVDTQKPLISAVFGNPYTHQVLKPIDVFSLVKVADNSLKVVLPLAFGNVNSNQIGSYLVYYIAFDETGNKADTFYLTVNVSDTINPVITDTLALAAITIPVFTSYKDPAISFTDNYWPSSSLITVFTGLVNTNVTGVYQRTVTCTDPSNNLVKYQFKVNVADLTKPEIKIIGNPVNGIALNVSVLPDTPIVLTDNYTSEDYLKTTLTVKYPVALNAQNKLLLTTTGLYNIQYQCTDLSGNKSDVATYLFSVNASSIKELNAEHVASIYPNPANNYLIIEPKVYIKIKLYNNTGMLTMQQNLNEGITEKMDITDLSAGVYLLVAETNLGSYYKKIIKPN